jgi:hypothetical protein
MAKGAGRVITQESMRELAREVKERGARAAHCRPGKNRSLMTVAALNDAHGCNQSRDR